MDRFPLPVTLFSRELIKACTQALDDALQTIDARGDPSLFADDVKRVMLAHGIVIAATLGVRKRPDLARAALSHLAQVTRWSLPSTNASSRTTAMAE